jgi:hypothetical protein
MGCPFIVKNYEKISMAVIDHIGHRIGCRRFVDPAANEHRSGG